MGGTSASLTGDASFRRLKEFIVESTGLAYYSDRDTDLAVRIGRRFSVLGLDGCAAYVRMPQEGGTGQAEFNALVAELTIGETYSQMPEMDGCEATGQARRRKGASRHTPIIALTTGALARNREWWVQAGMDDYLSKPVRSTGSRAVLARWVGEMGGGIQG